MISRRRFLGSAGLAAMSAATGVPSFAGGQPQWPRYRQAMAIDALSGIDFLLIDEKDPAAADALQHVRDCGLTAVVMTAAPQGRFWLDDAAHDATRKRIDEWKARIARHPDALLLVRSRADLERAHREKRVGVILTFQGTEPAGVEGGCQQLRTDQHRAVVARQPGEQQVTGIAGAHAAELAGAIHGDAVEADVAHPEAVFHGFAQALGTALPVECHLDVVATLRHDRHRAERGVRITLHFDQ